MPIATASTEAVISSNNTAIHDNFGAADAPVPTAEKKDPNAKKTDIVHPNDRLLRILRENSVKNKLPSVAFWDPEYAVSSKLEDSHGVISAGLLKFSLFSRVKLDLLF